MTFSFRFLTKAQAYCSFSRFAQGVVFMPHVSNQLLLNSLSLAIHLNAPFFKLAKCKKMGDLRCGFMS